MHLFQFVAAWLFPGAVCAAAEVAKAVTAAESLDPDNASSWLVFSIKAADDSTSSLSLSPSSSSSSEDLPKFFTSRQQSPPASPLCFGAAGGAGGLRLWASRGARARSPTKKEDSAAAASTAPAAKGDVVGRYLRKISRRLRKARAPNKGSPSPGCAAVDDTVRERAESVARAVSYCKDTLRRGTSSPRPAPSPSLDDWLHDRQEEIVASAAAYCNDGSTDSQTPPRRPRLDGSLTVHRDIECRVSPPPPQRDGGLAEMQAMGKQCQESPRLPSPSRHSLITDGHVVESPHHGHDAIDECRGESVTAAEPATSSSPSDLVAGELEKPGSFDEMQFLKIFDGGEEMIGHHFITVQI
ncbi:hypothetical protein BAE44_0010681 [Dichanthelium oligosanthes]|uniref:Uncharacterized protein n=1 Tax=Dichanthelium oligosanthes TaxID=888268 RepID=A0A1E5VT70_9POAL|nr:hypothetical protein BAE44_0010681 [Dichanthelium oligosanthes]